MITTPPLSLLPEEDKFLFTSFLFLFTLFSRLSGVEGFECELLCVLSASLRLSGGTVARGGLEDRGEELFILVTPAIEESDPYVHLIIRVTFLWVITTDLF